MRNKYKGICSGCGKEVLPKQGYFQRVKGTWIVWCIECTTNRKVANKQPLSNAQKEHKLNNN
jgi:hypothetical protein